MSTFHSNAEASTSATTSLNFYKDHHINYFLSTLRGLPEYYSSLDTTRLTAVYFSVVGLDLLGALDRLGDDGKQNIINFIYAMQIPADETGKYPGHCGFVGSGFLGQPFGECSCVWRGLTKRPYPSSSHSSHSLSTSPSPLNTHPPLNGSKLSSAYDLLEGHLAMTYVSLATLLTLGDDLSRIDKASIVSGMKHNQQPNGSFSATLHGSECDTRFVYCACAIAYMLNDWSGVDKDAATKYIQSCISYEGGIALIPGAEAHGGSTYCGTAALVLMNRLDSLGSTGISSLGKWCQQRQIGGYQGRTNKEPDSCYSFWIGATLQLLGIFADTDIPSTLSFVLIDDGERGCQSSHPSGGFSKTPEGYPDVLHSFYSICWLSLAMHVANDKLEQQHQHHQQGQQEQGQQGQANGQAALEGWELGQLDVRLAINPNKIPLPPLLN